MLEKIDKLYNLIEDIAHDIRHEGGATQDDLEELFQLLQGVRTP